ncbi:DUF6565 domain-containing protein [Flavobacterium sp.]|uniref:DUF6565 domain-containing protein n=1 Tax=Flavobacterium sp. TaxID=239 RepID=UPI003753DDB7
MIKLLGLFLILVAFTSCKSEQEKRTELLANNYVKYIDSLINGGSDAAAAKWDEIEKDFDKKTDELNIEVDKLEDKSMLDRIINTSTVKYETFKKEVVEKKSLLDAKDIKLIRNKDLFGIDYIKNDTKFEWVNKDNILDVYTQFVTTVSANKNKYSREDWDEIKMQYEALDSRKNTVEKEGLTSGDNMKIAGLKLKFAPMYQLNRIAAKNEENANAKN